MIDSVAIWSKHGNAYSAVLNDTLKVLWTPCGRFPSHPRPRSTREIDKDFVKKVILMDCSQETSSLIEVSQLPPELIEVLKIGSNSTYLAAISSAALQPGLTEQIFTYLEPLSIEIVARWTQEQRGVAAPAFGRILAVMPYLLEPAQQLFPPSDEEYNLFSPLSDANILREVLLSIFRLLRCHNDGFADLVRPVKLQVLLHHVDRSIRYLAIRLLCLYVHASDAVMEEMVSKYLGPGEMNGNWEGKEIDYRFLSLWETKRVKNLKNVLRLTRQRTKQMSQRLQYTRIIRQADLSSGVVEICGVLLFRSQISQSSSGKVTELVPTSTTVSNLQHIAAALLTSEPLLVTGLPGSGKTTLVQHVASLLNKSTTMVTLHLNEQSDAKLLIGIYTTGSQPGSFEWQPGVLTTAVIEGRWVLIEDLDRAPNEVLSTILPLIERRELSIPSRGEILRAASGFRIIATIRSNLNLKREEVALPAKMLGQRLWRRVSIQSPSLDEIQQVIIKRHPILSTYLPRIISVYNSLHRHTNRAVLTSQNAQARMRPISIRELFNWCARLSDSLYSAGVRSGYEAISEHSVDSMFLDALDCFAGSLEDDPSRDVLVSCVAQELHIDPQRKEYLLRDRTPSARRSKTDRIDILSIGRATLSQQNTSRNAKVNAKTKSNIPFALNGYSLRLLEKVAVAVQRKEPLLLVGETGIGKTTAVQHLAQMLGQNLIAINLSQQSESGDLLGGLKPVNTRSVIIPLKDEFDILFDSTFSQKKNRRFLELLSKSTSKGQWKRVVTLWKEALKMVDRTLDDTTIIEPALVNDSGDQPAKRRKIISDTMSRDRARWNKFAEKIDALEHRLTDSAEAFMFTYMEGNLVKAVREGHWVLLDEINLATPDTLECLTGLLESGPNSTPSIMLTETGNVERVTAHPNFQLFAAMNPATDVGKKDLPMGIRSRFTEIYVNSPDRDVKSLQSIVKMYLDRADSSSANKKLVLVVTELYQEIQHLVREAGLVDGSGQRPHYSLRTLTRALAHTLATASLCSIRRALYEGFSMCFFTALNNESESKLQQLVKTKLFGDQTIAKAEIKKPLRQPDDGKQYQSVPIRIEAMEKGGRPRDEQYWVPKGQEQVENPQNYIVTPYIARNLRSLIRAASTRKHPILIQGPTSAGKTSMVEYLAKRSGNKFVRINNHEHTDLQEYLGSYVSTSDGRLVFQEGVLVQAVRAGHWVVLDELNLAPTDVLEALNRLLDDNRELLVPETQEIVRPHNDFMLFATQNPAGPYGGRKMLSRAFRNRFLELHFEDIPIEELNVILARRSSLPESWCGLIVEVYKALSQLRQEQRLFEQNSFATLRDLFRWAFRGADSVEELADNGYMLLAEKVRKPEESVMVKNILEKVMSRKGIKIQIDPEKLYAVNRCPEIPLYDRLVDSTIVWTKAMRRLFVLVSHAIRNNEAVLLVGETGCGKTTVCQMLAKALGQKLHIVNAHQNTETGDLIGAQRPVRGRAILEEELINDLRSVLFAVDPIYEHANHDVDRLLDRFDILYKERPDAVDLESAKRITSHRFKRKALFEWNDGSLVQAMRSGDYYLLDEISLADDSVLERMNSVLDPQRSILLAEKGTQDSLVTAKEGFQFFATMNPGGDFGKKELSPALRNRFTEIWVPHLSDSEDILQIVHGKLKGSANAMADVLVTFARWFSERYSSMKASAVSIRDILAWVQFINSQPMDLISTVIHGAALVYIDTLGANPAALLPVMSDHVLPERNACLDKLSLLLNYDAFGIYYSSIDFSLNETYFTLGLFSLMRSTHSKLDAAFNFHAPTTKINAMRVVRALQLTKPVLLEGNPGVGKTSIVSAIAKAAGKTLTRINLSEQTDLMDLFGSDVPLENEDAGHFAWRDAPFLIAMKRGDWILLDEMNLASQSILEGLNACLDHRGEVYVAELDQTFSRHPDFRLFAAQNPHHQGGGRKGLPASFVNRFTVVYADVFKQEDLHLICTQLFPSVDNALITKLVSFVTELDLQVTQKHSFGARGAPWEFNLRDTLRWLQLIASNASLLRAGNARDFYATLFVQRFRTASDVHDVGNVFTSIFGEMLQRRGSYTNMSPSNVQLGLALLPRSRLVNPAPDFDTIDVRSNLPIMESLLLCVQQNWPVILVGSAGAGKSYLLNTLASLVGAKLEIFALNADIDATDLIGGYEQADTLRQRQAILRNIEEHVRIEVARQYSHENESSHNLSSTALLEALEALRNVSSTSDVVKIQTAIARLIQEVPSSDLILLAQECRKLLQTTPAVNSGKFEWIDGTLVKALENGYWLVLDNANLCSSAVLDRLNSLLEPNGSLIVNEHCLEDGSPRIIKPHPNFRIFMTMDPQYGEVSRAMRNRAVEIYLPLSEKSTQELSLASAQISSESQLCRFLQYINICDQAASRSDYRQVAETTSRILSFSDLTVLTSFAHQVEIGLMESQFHTIVLAVNLNNKLLFEEDPNWCLVTSNFYQSMQAQLCENADFCNTQSIYPLTNQPVINYNDKLASIFDPYWLCHLHDILVDIVRMKQAIVSAQSMQHNIKTMNRLQRSFASGRIPQANKESTYRAAPFLMNVLAAMSHWRRNLGFQKNGDLALIKLIKYVQRVWWDLFNLVSMHDFEEAVFQIHLQLITSHVLGIHVDEIETRHFLQELSDQFQSFRAAGQLTTGLSMERLWNSFRPATVSTMEQLTALVQLENLADRFDGILWQMRMPIEDLCDIRKSIAQAIRTARHQDIDVTTLLQDLESSISQITVENDSTANLDNKPFFQNVFEGLNQYSDLIEKAHIDLCWYLDLFACRATKSHHFQTSGSHLTALALENISHYTGLLTQTQNAIALNGDVPALLLEKLVATSETPLRKHEMLHFETKILGRCLAVSTHELCSDQIRLVYQFLQHLFNGILSVHSEFLDAGTVWHASSQVGLESLKQGSEIVFAKSLPDQHYFRKIAVQYLQPLLPLLHSCSNQDLEAQAVGEGLIRLALGCLLLYIPNQPFDPALKAHVVKDLHDRHYKSMFSQLDTLLFIEQRTSGELTNLQCDLLRKEIDELGQSPSIPAIARPPVHHLNELQVEFNNVLRLIGRISQEMSQPPGVAHTARDLIKSISQAVIRLKEGFRVYEDLTSPVVGFLNMLVAGLHLLTPNEGHNNSALRKYEVLSHSVPFMASNSQKWLDIPEIMTLTDWRHDNDMKIHILRLFSLRAAVENISNWTSANKTGLVDIFDRFYIDWKTQLTQEQREAAASTSLYTYRGSQDDEDEDDTEQFNEMFPAFIDDSEADADKTKSSKPFNVQKRSSFIAGLHMQIFRKEKGSADSLEDLLRETASLVGQKAGSRSVELPRWGMQDLLPAILLFLKKQVDSNIDQKPARHYNIYTDANISEAKRLNGLVAEIQACLKPIIQAWPEHATLHNIQAVCEELLALRNVESVMKILTKAEKLYDYLAEWQSVASREFSIGLVFSKLTDLLISWRQLELSTWARLLDLEMEKCEDDARSWWFIAYENIIIAPQSLGGPIEDKFKHSSELIEVLESFMSKSAIGQYNSKLEILRSLQAHVKLLESNNDALQPVCNALGNFILYFERYVPKISETIYKGRQELAKQVQNIIQLATWKDRNISALKQSAKSSHRRLFRIVKKFRNLLAQPAVPYLQSEMSIESRYESGSSVCHVASMKPPRHTAISVCRENIKLWTTRPIRFREIEATVKMMQLKTLSDVRAIENNSSMRLMDFDASLDASMAHLQKATPSILTEENASFVKHLTTRKRKLFTDTLKDVRQMGVKSNVSSDVLGLQNSSSNVLSRMPLLPLDVKFDAVTRAQTIMLSVIGLMSTVRRAISEHSEDLQQNEIVRSVGYLEGFLSVCLKQRRSLVDAINKYVILDLVVLQIQALWSSTGCQAQFQVQPDDDQDGAYISRSRSIPTVFRVGARILTAQGELGGFDFASLVAEVNEQANTLDLLSTELSDVPALSSGLINTRYIALVDKLSKTLTEIKYQIKENMDKYPDSRLILNHLQNWVHIDTTSNATYHNGYPYATQHTMISSQYEMLDLMLGSIQDVAKAKQQLQLSEDQSLWLVREDIARQTILQAFHAEKVGQSIQDVLLQLPRLAGGSDDALHIACASLASVLPIIEQYQASYHETISEYAELHAATCLTTYKLARSFNIIAKQGFCKPAEKSDDKTKASDKLESGTGLGEGEGAEDISKDIGADEDLSELAQDQNNRQPEHEMEKNDDAVDIEDEFEGAAGDETGEMEDEEDVEKDAESQSGDEGNDGSIGGKEDDGEEIGGKDAIDEDIGSVDDLGPSAVDEKLWDEAGDDENKEKKGTQQAPKNLGEDEQAAGKEDSRKQAEEARDEGSDGQADDDSGSDIDGSVSEFGSEVGSAGQDEIMDPNVKESEALELPEDMHLDGDKDKQDEDMDANSDEDMLDDLDDMEDGKSKEEQDSALEQPNTETEAPADEQGQQEHELDKEEIDQHIDDRENPHQDTDQGQNDSNQEMVDSEMQPGRGEANESLQATSDQQDNPLETRNEGPEDESKDPTSSASNAQHKTGLESQAAEKTQPPASNEVQDSQQQQSRPQQESSDRQNLRKLGNILEKWHRQQREIREAAEEVNDRPEEQSRDVDMGDVDFAHLPDEETEADTQALGSSSKEQAKALDESMAVESTNREDERSFEDFAPGDVEEAVDEDEDVEMKDDATVNAGRVDGIQTEQPRTFIGQRQELDMPIDNGEDHPPSPFPEGQEEDETLDNDLSTLQLTTRPVSPSQLDDPRTLWTKHTQRTTSLSHSLTAHLRLILTPTLATRLRGDFRTGKRLNIKRIIPYIASQYKRDRIWLRRSAPTKRAYQIMLALDDSKSMAENGSADMAFDTLALVANALTALEAGELAVLGFGADVFVAQDFGAPFSGADVLGRFGFGQTGTDVRGLIARSIEVFRAARARAAVGAGVEDLWQLQIVLSDGICEDHEGIRRLLVTAQEERIMVVFVIVDAAAAGGGPTGPQPQHLHPTANQTRAQAQGQGQAQTQAQTQSHNQNQTRNQSILDLEKVEFIEEAGEGDDAQGASSMKLIRKKYLDTFPFPYYLVVRDVAELPGVLAAALRQWFAEVAER